VTDTPPSHAKVIIIGSGPAAYTAAIYAARAMLAPILIQGYEPGGQLMITTDVENYPGFPTTIQGPWLMEQMSAQAEHVGTRLVQDYIVKVELGVRPFTLHGDGGARYTCDSLIIATGAKAKWLGLPSEEHFKGQGVSACATCDGFFFRGKKVVVIGGGNSAVEEALYLAHLATHVTLVHRRDSLRAERVLQERLFAHPKIDILWNAETLEVCGDETPLQRVTHVRLRDFKTHQEMRVETDGVFVAIGHTPASEIFKGQLSLRADGYIQIEPGKTATNIPGVFAAGDVADWVYRQAVTAAGMGCMAALEAERWLGLEV
jgi:thioredoxin reductase (NADPH)